MDKLIEQVAVLLADSNKCEEAWALRGFYDGLMGVPPDLRQDEPYFKEYSKSYSCARQCAQEVQDL